MSWTFDITRDGSPAEIPVSNFVRNRQIPCPELGLVPLGDDLDWVAPLNRQLELPTPWLPDDQSEELHVMMPTANFTRADISLVERTLLEGELLEETAKEPKPSIPNIDQGLGKQRAKKDLVQLEEFVSKVLHLNIIDGELCLYEPPCWQHLDKRTAEMVIRSCLRRHHLADSLTEKECSEIRKLLEINQALQLDTPFSSSDFLLNLKDGTLDIRTEHLLPHRPEDGFFSFLDVRYRDILDPPNNGAQFEAFVSSASQWDPNVRRQILELIGLAISGIQAKKFFLLVGPTGTGKSQLGRFIRELIGTDQVMNVQDIDDFGKNFTCGYLAEKKSRCV